MKKAISFSIIVFCILACSSCTKDSTSNTTPSTAKCKPLTESSNFNSTSVTYTYSYNTDGTLAKISYPPYNMAVGYNATSLTYPATHTPGLFDSTNISYTGDIYTGSPGTGVEFLTIDGITIRYYHVYTFSYDSKNRLTKVITTTPNVANDAESQLTIIYNDQDNVTQLKYEAYNGAALVLNINATGYDDKPSPYSEIKNWRFFMHVGWSNYDPAPILEALSKNNPLGFNITGYGVNASTISRTMAYTYNENGFPLIRTNTNKNSSGTYSFDETYTYECK